VSYEAWTRSNAHLVRVGRVSDTDTCSTHARHVSDTVQAVSSSNRPFFSVDTDPTLVGFGSDMGRCGGGRGQAKPDNPIDQLQNPNRSIRSIHFSTSSSLYLSTSPQIRLAIALSLQIRSPSLSVPSPSRSPPNSDR